MRYSRNAKTLAVLSAAAGLAASVQVASAQVWNLTTSSTWNNAANWVGGIPASAATTAVTFNAGGTTSYTATNDVPTTPPASAFQLNSLSFGNNGTGLITVAGKQMSFVGTAPAINENGSGNALVSNLLVLPGGSNTSGLSFGGTGAGTVTLTGALSSSPNAGGTSGAALFTDNPNGRLAISGGGTLYGLRANRGNMFVTGGVWSMTSTQRGNDVAGAPDDGFWGVLAGNSNAGPGSITFSNGAKVSGNAAYAGNNPGQSGVLTFTDPGTVGTFTVSGFGRCGTNWGTGTIQILNGAAMYSTRVDLGRNDNGVGTLIVSGANSTLNSANLDLAVSENTSGTGIISGGGKVILTDGGNTSALSVGWATGPLGDALMGTGNLRITGAGSSVSVVNSGAEFSGQFVASAGGPGVPSVATVTIDSGGHLDAQNSFLGDSEGHAVMTVDGATSTFVNNGQFSMGSSIVSSLTLSNGAHMDSKSTDGNFTSGNPTDKSQITVSSNAVMDMGANVVDSFAVLSGGGTADGGTTTLTINTGGEVKANLLVAATDPNSVTNMTVDGANSKMTIAGDVAQLVLANDNGANANMTVSAGGRVTIGANGVAFLSSGTTSVATMTVTGANSVLDASAAGAQLQVGGAGSLDLGAATLNILNTASANVGDVAVVFTPGVINIGSGTAKGSLTSGSGGTFVDGTINFNAGTFNTAGTLGVGGSVLLSNAGRGVTGTATNKKMVEAGKVELTSSGVIDLNDNDMLIHDTTAGARQVYEGYVRTARNGGLWNMPGITSTAAKNAVPKNKNLGVISGADFAAGGGSTFNGKTVVATDTLIKFTFNGDTDLNGKVDFDDYSHTDNGFNNHRTGWFNGDFDYNGVVDFDDYSLIDQAFNTQGSVVLNIGDGSLAGPAGDRTIVSAIDGSSLIDRARTDFTKEITYRASGDGSGGSLQAVPEPGTFGLTGVALLGALARRRRAAH